MSKHTPEPWVWYWKEKELTPTERLTFSREADCGVVSAGGLSVCRTPRYQNKERWEADARLIIAAPAMYRKLQFAVEAIQRIDTKGLFNSFIQEVNELLNDAMPPEKKRNVRHFDKKG